MNDIENVNYFWLIGGIVLAASALVARRAPIGVLLRAFLGWAIIGAVAWAAIAHRDTVRAYALAIGERFGIGDQTVDGTTTRITMSEDGHFWAEVRINDVRRRMLIDSGATITALSEATARAAAIDVEESTFPMVLRTANGDVAARHATAAQVAVGSVSTRDLGVVVAPAFGDTDVLGMNFLSRLASWRVEGRTLVLEPRSAEGSVK